MKELPTAQSESQAGPTPGPPGPPEVQSSRLMATLGIAGALAGLVIVVVFQWADPRIQAHRAAALRAAVLEVLDGPATYRSLYVTPEGLSETAPPGVDTVKADKVFLGFDTVGEPVGYAVTGAEPGFQDVIYLIFGFDARESRLLGMKVLESKETPGLGDKIIKDADFVGEFRDVEAPIAGVKKGAGSGAANEVDMITGATISSRTVIGIINHRVEALGSTLREHAEAVDSRVEEAAPTPAQATLDAPVAGGAEGGS